MENPTIIAYLKPFCGWSQGVRAVFRKYELPFEDRDIWNDPRQRMEMIQKSGQELSPCVEVDGTMLPDISGEELERGSSRTGSRRRTMPRSTCPLTPLAPITAVVSTP